VQKEVSSVDEKDTIEENQFSVSFVRQPIFDEKHQLWGYELFGVGNSDTTLSGFPEGENVAISVASGAYIGLQQILDRGKKVIVNFNEKSILEKLPYALPPVLAAVKVTEDICSRPQALEALKRLKEDGYLIAVSQFTANPQFYHLYQMADILSIETADKTEQELAAILETTRDYQALLLASLIENPEKFAVCERLGFTLFHGSFFKSPVMMSARKLTSIEISRFNLLRFVEKDQPDTAQLAKTIQTDVSMSFRLLTYLNSVAFGFPKKITSIHQAILLLGWRKMKNWLQVVLLADMSKSKDAHELVLLSAQRGRFLELVAQDHDYWGFDSNSLNLLGIFSLLDALIGIPMEEIVSHLPLENKLKTALCREPNNEYLPLLELSKYFEEARWAEAEQLLQQLNLDKNKVKAAFRTAASWAGELEVLN
jgi:EAL and modified HD-GYP domain-containing signal transduction protein